MLLMFLLVLGFYSWGVKQDCIPHVGQLILTYVHIKVGIVHPYKNGFLYCCSKILPFPAHIVEVVQCCGVACGGMMAIYRWRWLKVFFESFTKYSLCRLAAVCTAWLPTKTRCSSWFSNVLFIAIQCCICINTLSHFNSYLWGAGNI